MKRLIIVSLIVILSFLSFTAYQEYLAASRTIEARELLNTALSGDPEKFTETLERGVSLLNGEGFLFYEESINPFLSATLYSMLANNEVEPDKRQQYLKKTFDSYLLQLKSLPTNGPAWAAAALTKIQLGQFDSDLEHYIENAYDVGYFDPKTHMKMAIVALNLVRANVEIKPAISEMLVHHLTVGLKNPKSKVTIFYSVMEREGIRERICAWKLEPESAEILKCPETA